MLLGFTSRWTTPWPWAYARATATSPARPTAKAMSRRRSLAMCRFERRSLDERHDVEGESLHVAGVENWQDVGVFEGGGDSDLARKTERGDGPAQFAPEQLEGDVVSVAQCRARGKRSPFPHAQFRPGSGSARPRVHRNPACPDRLPLVGSLSWSPHGNSTSLLQARAASFTSSEPGQLRTFPPLWSPPWHEAAQVSRRQSEDRG